MHMILTELK